jgi:hypothetical protein
MPLSRQEEMDERKSILENDLRLRNQGTTFSQFAESDAATSLGRFNAISNPTVVGSGAVPNYPAGPAWCAADQEVEPPLGVDVNSLEPTGEIAELKASRLQPEPSISSPAQATPPARPQAPPLARRAGGSSRTYRRA